MSYLNSKTLEELRYNVLQSSQHVVFADHIWGLAQLSCFLRLYCQVCLFLARGRPELNTWSRESCLVGVRCIVHQELLIETDYEHQLLFKSFR